VSRVTSQEAGLAESRDAQRDRGDRPDEAVEVLRAVWTASRQTSEDLDELFGPAKTCKNMRNVGFDDLDAADGALREAWRTTLEREGKLSKEPGSVRDLVFGPGKPGSR
jgi:hypothetical protein